MTAILVGDKTLPLFRWQKHVTTTQQDVGTTVTKLNHSSFKGYLRSARGSSTVSATAHAQLPGRETLTNLHEPSTGNRLLPKPGGAVFSLAATPETGQLGVLSCSLAPSASSTDGRHEAPSCSKATQQTANLCRGGHLNAPAKEANLSLHKPACSATASRANQAGQCMATAIQSRSPSNGCHPGRRQRRGQVVGGRGAAHVLEKVDAVLNDSLHHLQLQLGDRRGIVHLKTPQRPANPPRPASIVTMAVASTAGACTLPRALALRLHCRPGRTSRWKGTHVAPAGGGQSAGSSALAAGFDTASAEGITKCRTLLSP